MTQQEHENIKKMESVWGYLGDRMIKAFGTDDFVWYEGGLYFYDPIFKTNHPSFKVNNDEKEN